MKDVDLYGYRVYLRCRLSNRFVKYNPSWIDYNFLPPWELVEGIDQATHNPALIAGKDFTDAMMHYLNQRYEFVKAEVVLVKTIEYKKEILMETSNGGKTIYLCPRCGKHDIRFFKTKAVFATVAEGDVEYFGSIANKYRCFHCHDYFGRSSRIKMPVKLLAGTLEESLERVRKFYKNTIGWGVSKFATEEIVRELREVVNGHETLVEIREIPDFYKTTQVKATPNAPFLNDDGVEWSPKYKDDMSHWTHGPNWFGIWAPYNGWRFKDRYNIELWCGEILKGAYPNGNGWYVGQCLDINDYHVRNVQLCPFEDTPSYERFDDDESVTEHYAYRARRNAEMFGPNGMAEWKPVHNEAVGELDPQDPNLTDLQKQLIIEECKVNPWYFFNMVYRLQKRAENNKEQEDAIA